MAQSGTYPDRPVKMLVGFAAGGGTDVAAQNHGTEADRRPGAVGRGGEPSRCERHDRRRGGGEIAADGYTLMMGSQTTLAVAPALYRKFAIDAGRISSA
jgi:tripartite-type tricarboxylate transporter receptor subunit TctC